MLRLYKIFISPVLKYLFGGGCRYSPTCSEYAETMIKKHGFLKGGWMGIKRLSTCHPFARIDKS